ncbi:MAG: sigma-70 family RNA polymerase sigma factor [Bacilli bacterium]|nr:sigma-70 family RNA polymerase sigma factor [Bacilli bacterium]
MQNNNIDIIVTNDIVKDRFLNVDYKPLSRKREINLIKKSKLSYYDYVDDELKEKYLNYYFEQFPVFKEKYEKSNEKEKLLEEAIENSITYREFFVKNNNKLVYSIVKKFPKTGDKFEDLYQEGMMGLIKALEKYDVDSGNKFSTYAIWWIREAIIRYFHNTSRRIRIPMNLSEDLYRLKKCRESLEIKLGREPSNDEIIQTLNITNEKLQKLLEVEYNAAPFNLDDPLSNETNKTLGDCISDGTCFTDQVDDNYSFAVLLEEIEKLNISERDKEIIYMRYGLNGEESKSISKVAKTYNLSNGRIRQIEERVLTKLRFNCKVLEIHDNNFSDAKPYTKVKKI